MSLGNYDILKDQVEQARPKEDTNLISAHRSNLPNQEGPQIELKRAKIVQDSHTCDKAEPRSPPAEGGGEAGHHWVGRPTGSADLGRVPLAPNFGAKISRVIPMMMEA